MKKMLSILMLVALVSAVPAFAADAEEGKVVAPKAKKAAALVPAPEAPKDEKKEDKVEAPKVEEKKDEKKEAPKADDVKAEDKVKKAKEVEETGFWSSVSDICFHPATKIVAVTSVVAGASALVTNWYNKNYVEKKKNRMNPGIIAAAAGLLTATAAGTYIFWNDIHGYVFAGQKATNEAAAKGDAASKELKEKAEAADKALKDKAPKAPVVDAEKKA